MIVLRAACALAALSLLTGGPGQLSARALAQPAQGFAAPPAQTSHQPAAKRLPLPLAPATSPPAPIKSEWEDLIGEYGRDQDKLYILESGGGLTVLGRSASPPLPATPLHAISGDTFQLAGRDARSEKLIFVRDTRRAVTGLRLGGVFFPRVPEVAAGGIFQIVPREPVDQLRREALASRPPVEKGKFREPELVDLTALDPTIKLDIRYATSHNLFGAPFYSEARAYLERPAAEALVAASRRLHALGYGLLVYDAYRPWYVTKMLWDGTPAGKKNFVANPRKGSRHNRGCAVDLTLYSLQTGQAVAMTGGYDEMSERSYPTYPGGTSLERWHRDLLRQVMRQEGFTVNQYEWWHFDYKDWPQYAILNLSFEELDKTGVGLGKGPLR